jgi:hypothetical protein
MTIWTITAEPSFVATASQSGQQFTSVDDVTDDSTAEEKKAVATGSTRVLFTDSTDSFGNIYASASYEDASSAGESFYVDGGLVEEVVSTGTSSGNTYLTRSWNGRHTESVQNVDTTYVSTASSFSAQTTWQTTSNTTTSAQAESTTTVPTTTVTGTTYSSNGTTFLSTTQASTTVNGISGAPSTRSTIIVTEFTTSASAWRISEGAEIFYPAYSYHTAQLLGDAVLWSVTSPNSGHFTAGAESYSGSLVLSSSQATRQGAVVTITNSDTFTATSLVPVTASQQIQVTEIQTSTMTVYPVGGALPLLSQARTATFRRTTTASAQLDSFAFSASSHLPTQTTVVAAQRTFAANLDVAETFTVITGTQSATTTAEFSTAGSSSFTISSGPGDFNNSPITNRTTTSFTSAVEWADSEQTGYNFAYGSPAVLSAAKYYPLAWAAASDFENAAQQVLCNVGSITLPVPAIGNRSVYAFTGSTTFSRSGSIVSASANGAGVVVTTSNSSTFGTSSAPFITQGAAATLASTGAAIAPGGKDGIGDVSVAFLPAAYNTSNSAGVSGTFLNSGQNLQVGVTTPKTAALGRPFYVGSRGPLSAFTTNRNVTNI